MSASTASQMKDAMLDVVEDGSGSAAAVAGVKVAGKTGTAETGSHTNSVFVGFAPFDTPTVAVSIMLEEYDVHGVSAASVASTIIRAALEAQGL